MSKRIFITGFVLSVFISLNAQQRMSLDDILKVVEKNNPSLLMYDAQARSLNEAAKGAYSWMPPEVGAGFFMTPYDPGRWKYMNGQPGMGMLMLSAQQMFPNKKKQDAEFAYMNSMSSVENEKKSVVMNELLYLTKKNFYEWIVLEKKKTVLDESSKILDFMIQSAEIRYKNGLGKISAYYKAKAALSNIDNMKLMLENEIAQKKIALNTLMYRKANDELLIDTIYSWREFNTSMFDSSYLSQQRSDIRVLERSINVNNLQRESELAKLKPEFGIRYDHMMGWARQPWQFSAMVMMKIPLAKWSSKMNRAKAESLVWENEALENQKTMILNDASGMAGSAKTELEVKKKQMMLYETQIIPALRKNFQSMQLGYEQNTEELFELFDAWEALNMTRLDYLDLLKVALLAQAELEKIMEIK